MISLNQIYPLTPPNLESHQKLMDKFKRTIQREDIGFFRYIQNKEYNQDAINLSKKFQHKKLLVHVGIGGSSLGPEMLLSALGVEAGKSVQFVNNIDTDMLSRQMKSWNVQDTFFYIVSKSGGTPETLAALAIITDWLKVNNIPSSKWSEYLVICTDPNKGDLRDLVKNLQLSSLTVPPSIGGRFSVLTDVGAFTAAWAGIDVEKLRAGAHELCEHLLNENLEKNILSQLTQFILNQYQNGRSQTVLMPYSSLLKDFTAWWVQLWGESLGKQNKGLTPVMAYGATDQHSQMQLFMQGPQDKVLILLECENSHSTLSMNNDLTLSGTQILNGFNLHQLMKAELEGTLIALKDESRPLTHLSIHSIDEYSLGKLILFFESLTVTVGLDLDVDPFNQPGVEAGKIYAKQWLIKHKNEPIR